MKITVLTGSPRKNGNTNHLASQFIKGAEEAGHKCTDLTAQDIKSLLAEPAAHAE